MVKLSRTQRRVAIIVTLAALTLAACASQPYIADTDDTPGFFMGLIHGFIAWFALIGHIFNHDVRIYAYPNAGGWYDFGFLVGATALGGGGGAAAR